MNCKNCNMELAEGALFCHNCGTRVEAACKACGEKLIKGASFCAYCGSSVSSTDKDSGKIYKNKNSPTGSKPRKQNNSEYSEADMDLFANDKSVYINNYVGKDFNHIMYQNKIYFISSSNEEQIWRMYKDGSERELVVTRDENDRNRFIGVNKSGVFTYDDSYDICVYNYSFDGSLSNKVRLDTKKDHYIWDLFIFDDKIYYITIPGEENLEQHLMSVNIDGSNKKHIYSVESTYDTEARINRVLATNDYAVFEVYFHCEERITGWYLYDLKTESIKYLNSQDVSPEEVKTNPEKFDYDSPSYVENLDSFEIFSFDLEGNIMWTLASFNESENMSLSREERRTMLFNRKIKPDSEYPIITDEHIWRLPRQYHERDGYIFNREYMFNIVSYYEMFGVKNDGTLSEDWNGTKHGRCNELQLTGDILVGDIIADYIDYWYPLQFEKPDSWHKNKCDWKTGM